MYDYETSEQLFLDIWMKYGSPTEVSDTNVIYEILNDLVVQSKHLIVLDHYSHINFDEIIKIEYDEKNSIFKLYWLDNNKYRLALLNHNLSETEQMIWFTSGYCTYEYLAIDISKIKFVLIDTHMFILIQASMNTEKELKNKIIGKNEVIEIENHTEELYARYIFWEGDKTELIKIECIANNLPYYVCVIQPKERIPSTDVSKKLLLFYTLNEIKGRLEKVEKAIENDTLDRDELFAKGNTIRNIMEYALKHFCVIYNLELQIEQRYGHIDLGELRKTIKKEVNIEITQGIVIKANELSHDSGKKYSINDIREFYYEVKALIGELQKMIYDYNRKNY